MKKCIIFIFFLGATTIIQAQNSTTAAEKEAAYIQTVNNRAAKIVAALNLSDVKKASQVTDLVAAQYRALNAVYEARDLQKKTAKESFAADKAALTKKLQAVDDETTKATRALHDRFLRTLAKELTPQQVDQIKDGMTYNVLHVTYKGYLDMLPNLTAGQKAQILTWLTEAREYAMDAESSEKKHGWFGKYKGRINNYLSAAGYDLKKEGEAWQKRLEEAKKQNNP